MAPQTVDHWHSFENVVAALYRTLGADAKQNVDLAGNQIDVYVEERTASGQSLRTAVECKFYDRPVGNQAVVQFATVAVFLRQQGLIDKAVLVAYKGFTRSASVAAQQSGLELVDFAELEARVQRLPPKVGVEHHIRGALAEIISEAEKTPLPDAFPETVFVAMPFSKDLEDVYIYGIRKSVSTIGLTCLRADELEFAGSVIDEIIDNVKRCRAVVAEISDKNPNVFYEVGWAHALGKPTILVARGASDLPFDVRHITTIAYESIHELEERLTARLRALLSSDAAA